MRSVAWLPVVSMSALVAGVCAFLLTSPNEPAHIANDRLGFTQLTRERVDGISADGATFHQSADMTIKTRVGAQRAAKLWLDGVVGSAEDGNQLPTSVRVGAITSTDRSAVGAFIEWADDLPRTSWTSTTLAATTVGTSFSVPARVDLVVKQSATRRRAQRVPVVLTIAPVTAGASQTINGWRVRGVKVGGRATWLRAYTDPTIIRRDSVDVIAPTKLRAAATEIANAARVDLPALRARYDRVASADVASIWIVESPARAKATVGTAAPIDATVSPAHATAWTDVHGEIIVDASRIASLGRTRRRAVLRHALTHLSLQPVATKIPPVLLEGVARLEEGGGALPQTELARLHAAMASNKVDLVALLSQDPTAQLGAGSDPARVRLMELSGAAIAAWIIDTRDQRRLVSLMRQLGDGVAVGAAVQNVLRMDPTAFVKGVRTWVAAQAAPRDDIAANPANETPIEETP